MLSGPCNYSLIPSAPGRPSASSPEADACLSARDSTSDSASLLALSSILQEGWMGVTLGPCS